MWKRGASRWRAAHAHRGPGAAGHRKRWHSPACFSTNQRDGYCMSNRQEPPLGLSAGDFDEDPRDPRLELSPADIAAEVEQIARYQAELTLEKTLLEIDKLNIELTELRVDSFRKWATLAAVITGVMITLISAVNKAPEAPPSKGVAHERTSHK